MKAEDYVIRPRSSFLFKGHNGTGKTIAACSEQFRPVYVFNCEGRFESVATYYLKRGNFKDIEWNDFPIGSKYYALDKKMDELVARCPYKTVVMSSLTSFIHNVLNTLIRDAFEKTENEKDKSKKQYGKRIGGIPVSELQDFNAEDSAIINDLIAAFQQLKSQGVNVILEAHITPYEITTIAEGQREKIIINQILTKGKKAPATVPGFFNEIYLFYKEYKGIISGQQSAEYYISTRGTPTDDCKTSWGINGFEWTEKDFSQLLFSQLSDEIKTTPTVDPNLPKTVSF